MALPCFIHPHPGLPPLAGEGARGSGSSTGCGGRASGFQVIDPVLMSICLLIRQGNASWVMPPPLRAGEGWGGGSLSRSALSRKSSSMVWLFPASCTPDPNQMALHWGNNRYAPTRYFQNLPGYMRTAQRQHLAAPHQCYCNFRRRVGAALAARHGSQVMAIPLPRVMTHQRMSACPARTCGSVSETAFRRCRSLSRDCHSAAD